MTVDQIPNSLKFSEKFPFLHSIGIHFSDSVFRPAKFDLDSNSDFSTANLTDIFPEDSEAIKFLRDAFLFSIANRTIMELLLSSVSITDLESFMRGRFPLLFDFPAAAIVRKKTNNVFNRLDNPPSKITGESIYFDDPLFYLCLKVYSRSNHKFKSFVALAKDRLESFLKDDQTRITREVPVVQEFTNENRYQIEGIISDSTEFDFERDETKPK